VIGEILRFTAFAMQAGTVQSLLLKDFSSVPASGVIVGLIVIGFGIKAGALPVHVWLPLAHPAAPTPASAVLSGAMIKAGLLGWLRFLPIGRVAMPDWGTLFVIGGVLAAYYAVVVGVTQRNPKTVLAYSSISQMGLITVGVGLAIGWPQCVPTVIPAIGIYAIHHGLAKGALFLGVGVAAAVEGRQRAHRLAVAGLVLASLALAGAPFTSGAVAKIALKAPLRDFQGSWITSLYLLLPLAAIGTTSLMARFLFIMTTGTAIRGRPRFGMWLSWTLTLLLCAVAVWMLPAAGAAVAKALQPTSWWPAFWPVGAGALASAGVWLMSARRQRRGAPHIPQGDLLVVFSALCRRTYHLGSTLSARLLQSMSPILETLQSNRPGLQGIRKVAIRIESRLVRWQTASLVFVILISCLFAWSLGF
jgi:formate hydrogenlyase subunit 3/multisubunit Na+/H+ antiporter MnhD subunit